MYNKVILGFINDLKSHRARRNDIHPALAAPPERQKPCQGGLHKKLSKFNSPKTPISQHTSNQWYQEIPFTPRWISRVILTWIQFRELYSSEFSFLKLYGFFKELISPREIQILNRSPDCYKISLYLNDSNFLQKDLD